jgi:multidrug efflux pump subunit AcrB
MVLTIRPFSSVTAFVGAAARRRQHQCGQHVHRLKPLNQRPGRVSADQVVNRLRRKLTSVPGATLFLQASRIPDRRPRQRAQYQYTLSDENLNELNTWAPQFEERA